MIHRFAVLAICLILAVPAISMVSGTSVSSSNTATHSFTSNKTVNIVANPCIVYTPASNLQNYPYSISPSQMNSIYNVTPLYKLGYLGQGQTVAIVDAYGDPYLNYDLSTFDAYNNLSNPVINTYYPYGYPAKYNVSWAVETSTDIEWVHSMAPLATIDLIITPNANIGYLQGAVNYTVNNMTVNSISLSWGTPESGVPKGLLIDYSKIFATANALGISVFSASGDQGALDGTGSPTVNFPASDPTLTAVGGSSIYYSNGKIYQLAWDGSGGGFSSVFKADSYQNASGFNGTMRGVPDISFDANPNSGGVYVFAGGGLYEIGGTSLATPIAAGIFMIISQYLGKDLGNVNPYLYALSRTVQYGNSIYPVPYGSNGVYSADNQWNPVTGLGTVNAFLLARAMARYMGPYGIALNFNQISNSSFTFKSNLSISTKVPLNSTNSSYMNGVGIYSSGSELFATGILQEKNGNYFYFKSGNKLTTFSTKIIGNVSAGISYNGTDLSLSVGNRTLNETVFPSTLYGSLLNTIVTVSTGMRPVNFSSSTISGVYYHSNSFTANNETASSYTNLLPYGDNSLNIFQIIESGNSYHFNPGFTNLSNFSLSPSSNTRYFNISQGYPPEIQFSNSVSAVTVNGKLLVGKNMTVSSGTNYNISLVYNSTTKKFNVFIPVFSKSVLHFDFPAKYYNAKFNITLDHSSRMTVENGSSFSMVGISTYISGNSWGFYPFINTIKNSNNINLTLVERKINVSFTAFPSSSILAFNGQTVKTNSTLLLTPESYNYSLSAIGFKGIASTVNLVPGNNITENLSPLSGLGNGYFLSGHVYNEYFNSLNNLNLNVPVSGANISINSTDYSITTSSGYYVLWVPNGRVAISITNPFYKNFTENLSLNGNQSGFNFEIYPSPKPLNGFIPDIGIVRVIPLLFFTSYVSWSTNIVNQISYFLLQYKPSGTTNWTSIKISSPTQTSAFVNGIYPGTVYDMRISVVLKSNTVVNSSTVQVSYNNPIYIGLSLMIYAGLGLYAYVVISYLRRRKRKKNQMKEFENLK